MGFNNLLSKMKLLKPLKSAMFPTPQEKIFNEKRKILQLESENKRLELERQKKLLKV